MEKSFMLTALIHIHTHLSTPRFDRMGNVTQAMEWINILISVVPTDPGILAKAGELYSRDNDRTLAFQSFSESYRYHPNNLEVLSWLGAYYVDCEVYDQALQFFERASMIQPNEVKVTKTKKHREMSLRILSGLLPPSQSFFKWQLMVASCHRRGGSYQHAFETYKKIHERFPDNVECKKREQ